MSSRPGDAPAGRSPSSSIRWSIAGMSDPNVTVEIGQRGLVENLSDEAYVLESGAMRENGVVVFHAPFTSQSVGRLLHLTNADSCG